MYSSFILILFIFHATTHCKIVSESECQTIRRRAEKWKPRKDSAYNDADFITSGVYLGNVCAAHNKSWLDEEGITSVIGVSSEWDEFPYSTEYYNGRVVSFFHFPLEDSITENRERTKIVFKQVSSVIHDLLGSSKRLRREEKILVHCNMGISRSSSAVLWYLQHFTNFSTTEYEVAEAFVRERRPVIRPNSLYREILIQSMKTTV